MARILFSPSKGDKLLELRDVQLEINRKKQDLEKVNRELGIRGEELSKAEQVFNTRIEKAKKRLANVEKDVERAEKLLVTLKGAEQQTKDEIKELKELVIVCEGDMNAARQRRDKSMEESTDAVARFNQIQIKGNEQAQKLEMRLSELQGEIAMAESKLADTRKQKEAFEVEMQKREEDLNKRTIELSKFEQDGRIYLARIQKEWERVKQL